MIFNKIDELQGITEKNFFKEKIYIYIMIVNSFCKKNDLNLVEVDAKWIQQAIKMGVLKAENQIELLKGLLGKKLFNEFKVAISTAMFYEDKINDLTDKLNDETRKKIRIKDEKEKKIALVDLFCGAGGLSLGFVQSGYSVKFANDFEPMCIETYKYNHPEVGDENIVCGDIRKISNNINNYITSDIDIVIGGPPCQGFSSANKHHRVIDDPRNELYKYFIKVVQQLAPKVVVMENVKGMLKVADQVIEDYANIVAEKNGEKHHYVASYQIFNSADFSVAQSRERLIYIAIRDDIIEKFEKSPMDIFAEIQCANKLKDRYNLSDALENIRPLVAPHKMGVGELDTEENGRKIDVNTFEGNENNYLRIINNHRKIPLVFNHKARYCSELNYEIYCRMNQGDDGTAPQIADIFPYTHRNDKFKDKYYRLYADKPCRTITAHLRADCHSHIHPFQDRAITPREAARIQSFPDDYLFLGPYLKTYIQIGNAVPPVMARGIARAIRTLFS